MQRTHVQSYVSVIDLLCRVNVGVIMCSVALPLLRNNGAFVAMPLINIIMLTIGYLPDISQ